MTAERSRAAGHAERAVARLRHLLPRGGSLPLQEWQRRHKGITAVLWANVIAVPVYGLLAGHSSVIHDLDSGAALAVLATLSATPRLSRKLRTACACLGLMSAAALLIYEAGGLLEMHFYFFVLIIVLTLYEDWMPFLLAVAYVLIHHGVLGMLDPRAVFDRPEEWRNPWLWASIHAGFVAAAGIAALAAWRLNENVRLEMRATSDSLRRLASEHEHLLEATRKEANTDALTGLANRRALMRDLESRLATAGSGRPLILAMFDLNGFKQYNDTFGHPAGDALLVRVGDRLSRAVKGSGVAYRMGGDEFCVLASGDQRRGAAIARQAAAALNEKGEAFAIDSSYGVANLPGEASTASDALRLADQRMYELKAGRVSASRQTTDVLLKVLSERSPGICEHTSEVARLSSLLATRLKLPEAERKRIELAAELHDIGKVAIPEAILSKPGPLDEEEWGFIHRHTEIGERIVTAAPSLAYTAELIRAHHERYDGRGYPDRLNGEEIPLGASIIAVCDAFGAMTKQRPYSDAISVAEALAEIRRCSGSHFPPTVAEAFCELIAEPYSDSTSPSPARGPVAGSPR
jgi:diguanylate cyclase (GGDEF)-like protein